MTGLIERAIAAHPTECMLIVGILGTAFASTFPEKRPKNLDDWWSWVRDFVHQLANAKRPTISQP